MNLKQKQLYRSRVNTFKLFLLLSREFFAYVMIERKSISGGRKCLENLHKHDPHVLEI